MSPIRRNTYGGYRPVKAAVRRPAPTLPPTPAPAIASMAEFAPPPPAEIPTHSRSGRAWSNQQRSIFSWFATGHGHLVVRARAGTGKTTTILEAISFAPEANILLCAFNKRIAVELQDRLTNPNAKAATLHSVGYSCVRRYWENVRMHDDRAKTLTERVCGHRAPDPVKRVVTKLHTHVREILPHADKASDIARLAQEFDCCPDPEWARDGFDVAWTCDRAIEAVRLAASEKPALGIDFADMIFLPVRNKWLHPLYDLIVVDECQDMSATQLEIAQGVLNPGGRIAVVGDDRQAVYGFRGADSGSLDRLKRELGAMELGLTTTYRCGKSIVKEAQVLVPDIEAAESNADGAVRPGSIDDMLPRVAAGEFILSRTNAPLIKVAMTLLREGRRVRIEGRDIGAGLRAVVRKLTAGNPSMSIREWMRRLDKWESEQVARAEQAELTNKADYVRDQASTLRALADDAATIGEIDARIEALFSDNGTNQIVCSSVHRAKGLEADRVWALAETFQIPVACVCGHRHPRGSQGCARCDCDNYSPDPAKAQEENNLRYVAITRAKHELIWV